MERLGVCDKGLVVRRCHGPSVLLIGPICLWQADLRPGMGLKYDTDLLHLQSTANECSGRWFVTAGSCSFAFDCVMASFISGSQAH